MRADGRAVSKAAGINRELVSQYFTGDYAGILQAHHRWRVITKVARYLVGVAGLVLIGITLYDLWRQTGTLMVWPIPASVTTTPAGLGVVLLLASVLPWLWLLGWELPAAFIFALTAAEILFLNFGDRRIMVLLMALALGGLILGVYLRVAQRRAPLELSELEPRLDGWTNELVSGFIAGTEIPVESLDSSDCNYIVRTFPKLERSGSPQALCRIGSDGRPRISPIGVGAFIFKPETLTVIEGAIDLTTEQVLYRRAHEFKHAEIASLLWTSDAIDASAAPSQPAPMSKVRLPAMGGAKKEKRVRHRDSLEIRLTSGRTVSLVFRDSAFLPSAGSGAVELESVEDPAQIRRLWHDILEHGRSSPTPRS